MSCNIQSISFVFFPYISISNAQQWKLDSYLPINSMHGGGRLASAELISKIYERVNEIIGRHNEECVSEQSADVTSMRASNKSTARKQIWKAMAHSIHLCV